MLRYSNPSVTGDIRLLTAARAEAGNKFRTDRTLDPFSPEAEQKILEAEQVAVILRQNIVQGQQSEAKGEEQKYKIRIHEDTEKLLNDDRSMRGSGGLLDGAGTTGCGSPVKGERMPQRTRLEQVEASKLS